MDTSDRLMALESLVTEARRRWEEEGYTRAEIAKILIEQARYLLLEAWPIPFHRGMQGMTVNIQNQPSSVWLSTAQRAKDGDPDTCPVKLCEMTGKCSDLELGGAFMKPLHEAPTAEEPPRPVFRRGDVIRVKDTGDKNFDREGPVVGATPESGSVEIHFEDHRRKYREGQVEKTGRGIDPEILKNLPDVPLQE